MADISEQIIKHIEAGLESLRALARSLGSDADKLRELAVRCEQADIRCELLAMAKEFDAASVQIIRELDSKGQ